MKKILNFKKYFLISFDILLIPLCFFCQWLSTQMLKTDSVCMWTILGGKCITCGGTHFVNTLLSGKIFEAFHHNELLFIFTVILLLSWILLHLCWFGNSAFAKNILLKIYSIPGLIIAAASTMIFLLIRNIPTFINLVKLVIYVLNKIAFSQ